MEMYRLFKVFIVDDDSFSLALYEQHLRNLGYTDIHIFSSGADVLSRLSDNPDVILLDFVMDPPDGLAVLKEVKSFNPDIYVVIVSGQNSASTTLEAVKSGAFDYIVKGSNDLKTIEEVLLKIKQVMEQLNTNKKSFFRRIFTIASLF